VGVVADEPELEKPELRLTPDGVPLTTGGEPFDDGGG
jgi:hypothetical protein